MCYFMFRFISSANRPNLEYKVLQKPKDVILFITEDIASFHLNDSGLVYCSFKKDCEAMAKALITANLKAAAFHSDISESCRRDILLKWKAAEIKVIVLVVAFFMFLSNPFSNISFFSYF